MELACRTISAPRADATRVMEALVLVSAPARSVLANTSIAFSIEIIFCSKVGSLRICVNGSLSNTEAEETPMTRARLSRARVMFAAAPELTIASTMELKGVIGLNGLLTASSTIMLMLCVNG